MQSLPMGGNASLNAARFEVVVDWPAQGGTLDASAYILGKTGKVRGDADMIFYNQRSDQTGALSISSIDSGTTTFEFDLQAASLEIDRIVICTTVEDPGKTMAAFQGARAHVRINGDVAIGFCPDLSVATEVAMQFVEVYRRNGSWKIRAVGQGFNAGLAALASSFGIDVAEEPATVTTPTEAPPRANLPPVAAEPVIPVRQQTFSAPPNEPPAQPPRGAHLDSNRLRHELKFAPPASLGILTGQLAWSTDSSGTGGRARPLELALGVLYELKDGRTGVVQLCDFAGSLDRAPYVQVLPDDVTSPGQLSLRINGDQAPNLSRCSIFAYIPRGAANWRCKSISFSFGAQDPITVGLPTGGDGHAVMGLVNLFFESDALVVERLGRHFASHRHLSKDLGWNLRWRSARIP